MVFLEASRSDVCVGKDGYTPYVQRLREELQRIYEDFSEVLRDSEIRYVNPNRSNSDFFFMGAADWGWAPSDPTTTVMRMKLKERYMDWHNRMRLLFPHPTPEVAKRLNDLSDFFLRWLDRPDSYDHSISKSVDQAQGVLKKNVQAFEELLNLSAGQGDGVLRLVPDTNSLIRNPDFASYSRAIGSINYWVHILPTVLRELDDLKDRGKTPELREHAQGVVRRLKGLRDKGRLAEGVKLTKTITVRLEHREVDAPSIVEWLDPTIPDDRIAAGALALQSAFPDGTVILVTSDLNLQNKADVLGLPYVETPPAVATLQAKLVPSINYRQAEGQFVPVVDLKNEGPAAASGIRYQVESPSGSQHPSFTCGPWNVPRLVKDETERIDLFGFFTDEVRVLATWTDQDGDHKGEWVIRFPPRPGDRPPPTPTVNRL